MGRQGGQKAAEMITRLVEIGVATLLEELETPRERAEQVMREIAHNLARDYGGGMMYFPKDHEFALTKRDMQIYNEMGRGNAAEIAHRHGLSDRQVYAISKHVRDQIMRKRQGKLPGFEDDQA
jgi:Mor family transcriptional regulator